MADNKPEVHADENRHHNTAYNEGLERIDTVHGDEAIKVLGTYSGDENWTPQEEKKLRRKIDWRLMPVLCNRYPMAAAIFYVGFILGAYPAVLLAQRYPIERVASSIIVVWGLTLILTPVCTDFRGLFAQRFFLGFTEAGISPMFMMIVGGCWYTKGEQSLRMGLVTFHICISNIGANEISSIWYCLTGYVSIPGPLINFGLGHIKGSLHSWKYMYYFAGGLTILWDFIIYVTLPPDPIRAKGFGERERFIAVSRMA
ncbi:hypothetical protein LTR96_011128 [Exophiala xenobiotica]|nr:hypothetical protein LTR41_011258 [Exophiala xenobiotica]KAK5215788.1 hypothetical protein LTR72_011202 [Exophiala xenobiotica]KAK5220902.1 hypothetical protein LTR47_011058 [Exophiala xenobiotica]KAK5245545.1 hypothetical protein LTS06_009067 [Exophiala xenobiotica]KAK5263494.1 hypothetical protein LTR96_011128 [Exophiala xenobiotica]